VPAITTTIDRDQRDGLYELVRNHLGGIEDFWIALERTRDFAKAEQLGLELSEDFRLLQDIGWGERVDCESFDLVMPASDLMELLGRLQREANVVLGGAQGGREDIETNSRFRAGYEACADVVADLAVRGGSQR